MLLNEAETGCNVCLARIK